VRIPSVFIVLLLSPVLIRAEDGAVLFRTKASIAVFAGSPDGKLAAVAGGDKTVHIIDLVSGKVRRTVKLQALCAAFSPAGKRLFLGGTGVTAWDVVTGEPEVSLVKKIDDIHSLAFGAGGELLATGAPRGAARIWKVSTGQEKAVFHLGHWGVTHVALSANGKTLAAAGNAPINPPPPGLPVPTKFMVWDVATNKKSFEGPWPAAGGPLLLSPDGKTLAAGAEGGLDLWDLASGKVRASLRGHHDFPQAAAFSSDGKSIATACEQGVIRLWNASDGKAHAFCRKAGGAVRGLSFFDGDRKLLSAEMTGDEVVLRVWDATDDSSRYLFMPLPNECFALGVSADSGHVIAASNAGVSRWDLKTGRELPLLKEHQFGLDGAAFSADGKLIAALDRTAELRLWDAGTGKIIRNRPKTGKFAAAFSPDGSALAVADYNNVTVLDTADGKDRFTLGGHRKQVTGIAFSPDGKTIVTVSQDQYVRWWDAGNGKPQASEKHGSSLASLAISPDGKLVASGAEDGTIRLWDLSTREIMATLEGPEKTVRCLAFSPDGKTMASGCADGSCRLWDVAEQKVRATIANAGGPMALAFLPGGKTLLSAGASRTIHLWDPVTGGAKSTP
jgi:WD40 repeat protein